MAKVTEAVDNFLQNLVKQGKHNNPELISWWSPQLETQVYVSPEGGFPLEERRNAWTDGKGDTWHHIRWPYNSNAEPYWRDRELTFLLEDHCTFIGSTGWCWVNRESWYVAFDFDDCTSHAPGVGIDDYQLEQVRQKAQTLPYVDVLKSTGGKGLHLYIRFDKNNAPKTRNHTEHAAVARALLGRMSTDCGFDFGSHLDVCGHIIWLWGKKATPENGGHTLIKKATTPLTADDLPPNWRDHIEVVSSTSKTKIRVVGYDGDGRKVDEQDALDELSSARVKYPLNDVHKAILNDLEQTGASVVWVPDHNLVQTHTKALKIIFDKWAEDGHPMKGFFETLSQGTDLGKPNCLAGDTMVVTRDGVQPIRSLAGKTATIITKRGKWVDAPFKSYGTQDVFTITIKRRQETKEICATKDHRWFVYRYSGARAKEKVNFGERMEVRTSDLVSGQILIQTKPQLKNLRPSIIGIQHGLVWGDGTNSGGRTTSQLPLFGKKDATLLKFFAEHPRREITNSIGGILITGLPYHFKSLVPLHYDKSYLYGWLAGYFAADGHVCKRNGSCIIRSANRDSITHVRQVCHILGIETTQITEATRDNAYKSQHTMYTTILKAADLTERFFLITKHRKRFNAIIRHNQAYWRVVSVEPAGQEEVFCCTVPETGSFCLEDFILTGNCFAIPGPKGSWTVYRFGKGVAEHKLWNQDDVGWTWCRYNWQPNLRQASLALGGKENEKGGFVFDGAESAKAAVASIGAKLLLPEDNKYEGRTTLLRKHKDGRLVVELDKWEGDSGFDDWLDKKDRWARIYNINTNLAEEDRDYSEFDALARSVRTPSKSDAGWMIRTGGVWVRSPAANVIRVLRAVAPSTEADKVMGTAILNQWTLVNMPFHEEHPGGRQWNYGAAQFKYKPADTNEPYHPHWDRILSHIGSDLDKTIKEFAWTRKWNIHSGRDYLTAWISCMFREPFEPLPYLFIYGEQGCGKSILHEAISLIVTGGIVKADTALTNQSDFNGELANGVLAVIDEKNIARAGPSVYNKIKEWVTGLTINIHRKGVEVYQQRNSLHFIQLANERDACPIIPGDTRITAISMNPLIEEIPKPLLLKKLEEEAPHFMATLMSVPMPESMTRLRLPVVETNTKHALMDMHTSPLEEFIREHCFIRNGRSVTLKEFYERFQAALSPYERSVWMKGKVRQNLPESLPVGNYSGNKVYIGNISFENVEVPKNGPKFIMQGGKLKLMGEDNE
jgi:hypothetical protein